MKPRSIILLSSGLDSTVSATMARRRTIPLFALTFDYCQRAAKMEIFYARKICRYLGIRHKIIRLPFFRDFSGRALIGKGPRPTAGRFLKLEDIWVPNRNGLFVNIAAAYAEHFQADLIVTGFNREEALEFPDNSPRFVAAVNKSLALSLLRKVKVVSFVQDHTKKEIYRLGLKHGAPLKYVYSCYLGGKKMCGKCASCRRLLEARSAYSRTGRIKSTSSN
jgi:7-cyano-7-deazaguanine synthase